MLFILVPLSLIGVGLVLAGRLVYKKIPDDMAEWDAAVAREDFGPTFYQRAVAAASARSKRALLAASTKLVRRLKITSLKTDNFFGKLLQEIKVHKENIDIIPPSEQPTGASDAPVRQFQGGVTLVDDKSRGGRQADIIKKMSVAVAPAISAPYKAEPLRGFVPYKAELLRDFAAKEQQLINQLAYNPKDVSSYKRLGWLYMENNKPMDARQAFKMAIKLGSKDRMIMAKLLEVGGVLHKEGAGAVVRHETVKVKDSRDSKDSNPVAKKSKIKKV